MPNEKREKKGKTDVTSARQKCKDTRTYIYYMAWWVYEYILLRYIHI